MLKRLAVAGLVLSGCRATTGRPPFNPFPEAEQVEIGFGLVDRVENVMRVTDTIAAYFVRDSIRFRRVLPFDGYLETDWLDSATAVPTGRRPLGEGVVRVRIWVDPTKPGYAAVNAETVSIPKADPSLPARDLEAPVSALHPVSKRVADVLAKLKEKYGIPEDDPKKPVQPTARPAPLKADSTAPADSVPVRDSAAAQPDSVAAAAPPASKPAAAPATPAPKATPDTAGRAVPKPTADTTKPAPSAAATPPDPAAKGLWVQVIAASSRESADRVAASLKAAGFGAVVVPQGSLFLVRAGPYPDRAAATAALARIRAQQGGEPFIVTIP